MSPLAAPLTLPCGARLSNRLAKAAMSEDLAAPDHGPSELLRRLYQRWAASGAGLLITGNLMIDRAHTGEPGNVILDEESHLDRLSAWAATCRAGGAAAWVQLNHPGRQAPRTLSRHPVAPSAVPMSMSAVFAPPTPLTEEGIATILQQFSDAADRARRAGFDGVELHAAHGYLLSQFLSPRTNLREDRWGGSLEGRARMLLEVVRAVRARVGPGYPVGVKLNSADFQRGGFASDEAVRVAAWLGEAGVDLLELSGGTYESPEMVGRRDSTRAREAYFLEYAEQVRAATPIPLMVTGGFRSRAGMEAALASGALDVVGLARPFAVNPQVARQLLDGTIDAVACNAPSTGLRLADDLLAVAWYQEHMERLGRGEEPDPHLGAWTTILRKGMDTVWRRAR